MYSIRDMVKTTRHPRQRSIILNGTKKAKSEFKPTKHFAKNVQNFSDRIYEKNFSIKKKVFKNLTPIYD